MTKEPRPDRDDMIHVASACEMTGSIPTPPLTNDEEDAYATLESAITSSNVLDTAPAAQAPVKPRRKLPKDPCGGGR